MTPVVALVCFNQTNATCNIKCEVIAAEDRDRPLILMHIDHETSIAVVINIEFLAHEFKCEMQLSKVGIVAQIYFLLHLQTKHNTCQPCINTIVKGSPTMLTSVKYTEFSHFVCS